MVRLNPLEEKGEVAYDPDTGFVYTIDRADDGKEYTVVVVDSSPRYFSGNAIAPVENWLNKTSFNTSLVLVLSALVGVQALIIFALGLLIYGLVA